MRDVKNPESIADHVFRTALITALIAEQEKLNVEKAIKIALIHDLPEIYIGDITPFDMSPKEKERLERKISKDLFEELGDVGKSYAKLLHEYFEQKSAEARIVKEADKLEFLIQGKEYEIAQKMKFDYPFAPKHLKNERIIRIYKELLSRP